MFIACRRDRVGKGVHCRSTAGYSAPRVVRSMQGTKSGLESMMYTGTAPNGFKSTRKQMKAQKCEACVARKLFCSCLLAFATVSLPHYFFLPFLGLFKCEVRIYADLRGMCRPRVLSLRNINCITECNLAKRMERSSILHDVLSGVQS